MQPRPFLRHLALFYLILIFGVCVLPDTRIAPADPLSSPDADEQQVKKVEINLAKEREQLLKYHEKERQLLKDLSKLDREIEEKKLILSRLRTEIGEGKADLTRIKNELRELEITQREIKERLDMRLIALYKNTKRGYLYVLTGASDLDQLQKRIKYLKMIMEQDQGLLRQMNAVALKRNNDFLLLKEKMTAISNLQQSENERFSALNTDNEKKVLLLMKAHKEKEFYETAVKELEIAAKGLKETIVQIEKKEIKISPSSDFSAWKGKLPFPFEGKIVEIEKDAEENFQKVYKGIYLEGRAKTEVKAVYSGTVDYSGLLKGYGEIVVINHGGRYYTVSAHLGKRLKEKGESVQKGEIIGLLESDDSTTLPKLYFEIRQGGISLNPLQWLKLH